MKEARETKNFDKPEFRCMAACTMKKAGIVSNFQFYFLTNNYITIILYYSIY